MRSVCFRLFLLGLFALSLQALASDVVYYEGSIAFDYEQWPWGSYDGSHSAAGAIMDPAVGWEGGITESVGGRREVFSDTLTVWAYGAILNADETVDVGAFFLRTAGGSFSPGTYPIDATDFMSEFAFFDDVTNFSIPSEDDDMAAWITSLEASHKFFGTSGSIVVNAIDESALNGTFNGAMADPNDFTIISITNGVFDLVGMPVSETGVEEAPALLLRHGNFPNPFNPKTRISFSLEEASRVRVSVYDTAGRELLLLEDSRREAGEVSLDWTGLDHRGLQQPAGVYLYRVWTPQEEVSGKMVLLP